MRNPDKCATLGSAEGVVSRNNEFRAAADLKAKVLAVLGAFETTLEVRAKASASRLSFCTSDPTH